MKIYDKYKPSGVSWIGDVPEHWEVKKLKYVGEAIIGITYSPDDVSVDETDLLVLRASNILNGVLVFEDCVYVTKRVQEKHLTKPGDILICARNGSAHLVGKSAYIDENSSGSTFGAFMSILRSNSGEFLYYFFNSQVFKAQTGLFSTSTINQLTSDTLNNLLVALPIKNEEQTAIADHLNEKTAQIDSLIDNKLRLIELLKEERTAIINQAVTRGIDPHAELKPSGIAWLGNIPEHWEVKKLKFVLSCYDTLRIPLNADERGSQEKIYDYYGASGVIDKVGNYLFEGEYILIGEDGANLLDRNSPLAFKATGKFWVNNHAHILRPMSGNVDFFTHLLESIDYTIWVSGSAQPKLTVERLLNVPLWLPPIDEQKRIVNFIEDATSKVDETVAKIEKEIGFMREYRTALISEVVTGKIKVV